MRLAHSAHITFSIIAGISVSHISHATTFLPVDCDKADSYVEKTICDDKQLGKLDKQVQQQITAAAEVSKVPTRILDVTQQQWISTRDQCQQLSCIADSYQERLTELKRYNLTDQHFVQHFIRVQNDGSPTPALSVMEIHKLDEKRARVIINSYAAPRQTPYKINHITFNAYANQKNHIRVKDLDSKCQLNINQANDNDFDVLQKSASCGTKHIRFSGHYQLTN